jgi:uncharacterized membrane protein
MSAARVGTSIGWGLIALLSIGVAGYALFHTATGFKFVPADVLNNAFPSPLGLEIHITASAVALLMGPFQFLKALRSKLPRVHRWMGRIYVTACAVGGAAGLSIALYSSSGLIAGTGFFLLAAFWLVTTTMAWTCALRRDFIAHERWMIRSFALTLAAVTLRLYLPAAIVLGKFQLIPDDFVSSYQVIAWACWVPNLIIAEIWIAMRRPRRPKVAPAQAPA